MGMVTCLSLLLLVFARQTASVAHCHPPEQHVSGVVLSEGRNLTLSLQNLVPGANYELHSSISHQDVRDGYQDSRARRTR